MPKKSKKYAFKRVKSRSKTNKKKSTFKRRTSYRKKPKAWWRKYKKRNYKRLNKGVLLKHTTKVRLCDLPVWIWGTAGRFLNYLASGPLFKAGEQNITLFTNDFNGDMNSVFRAFWSFDDDSVYNADNGSTPAIKAGLRFTAFNPLLDRSQLGPRYHQYLNKYSYMKYVGLKVKWKPNANMTNAFQSDTTNGKVSTSTNPPAYPYGQGAALGDVSTHGLYTDFRAPPRLFFNVTFDKDHYVSVPLHIRNFNFNYNQQPLNDIPDTYNNRGIFKQQAVFDNYEQSYYIKNRIKKYDMTKPFKFYVRPYESFAVQECIPQAMDFPCNDNSSAASDFLRNSMGLTRYQEDFDTHLSLPRPATWRPVSLMTPTWSSYPPAKTTPLKTLQYFNELVYDVNYYNPVLFGFFFTHEAIQKNSQYPLIEAKPKQPLIEAEESIPNATWLLSQAGADALNYFNQFGYFYFTVYLRFKGAKMQRVTPGEYQSTLNPVYQQYTNPPFYT